MEKMILRTFLKQSERKRIKMKKTIRRCVFETNSSSAHSLSLRPNPHSQLVPSNGYFKIREEYFGWTGNEVSSFEDKLAYLYALSIEKEMTSGEFLEEMKNILPSGVTLELPDIPKDEIWYRIGIDHESSDLLEVEEVTWEEFLFNNYYITIDHDNH